MAIKSMDVIHPNLAFEGEEMFANFCFLAHDFGSRYARKPLKGSNDMDHSLVFKKTRANNILIGLGPRARYTWPKDRKKCPHFYVIPRKPQTQNEKLFFFIFNSKTC